MLSLQSLLGHASWGEKEIATTTTLLHHHYTISCGFVDPRILLTFHFVVFGFLFSLHPKKDPDTTHVTIFLEIGSAHCQLTHIHDLLV